MKNTSSQQASSQDEFLGTSNSITTPDMGTITVADLFCGAGGSSTGAARAIAEMGGRMELVAVNHWPVAVETHQLNHPEARHYVQDLEGADPEKIVPEGSLDLLMASPECRFYSRARGGRPVHDQGRMNPWIVHRWLTSLNVRCLLIENVPEFTDWGPLLHNGRPDKDRKGVYFEEWVRSLWGLGYHAEWRMLNAADYGDATSRVRFFLQARNDGQPLLWPEPTHSKIGGRNLLEQLPKWRGAREIIDWSNPGRSLLDDPKYRKKPLSEKTRKRIAKGLERFGGPLAHLYIRLLDLPPDADGSSAGESNGTGQAFIIPNFGERHDQEARTHDIDQPVPTITSRGAGNLLLPEAKPFILNRHGENGSVRAHSLETPLPAATTRGAGYLVNTEAKPFIGANRNHNAPKHIDEPIPTVTTAHGGGSFLVDPELKPFVLGQHSCSAPRDTDQPIPTVATDGAISLVRPTIIEYYGTSHARDVEAPLSTITTCRKHCVVEPVLVEYYGNSEAADVDRPLPAVTTRARHGLANPTLVEINHGNGSHGDRGNDRRVRSVHTPLPSITTSPGLALALPVVIKTSQTGANGNYSKSTEDPLATVTTKNDLTIAVPIAEPCESLGDVEGPRSLNIDPRRLVLIDGQLYLLDIRFRMLQNSELARAMGFEDDETAYEFVGNVGQVTKQIGNAVPVNLATALVRAALTKPA